MSTQITFEFDKLDDAHLMLVIYRIIRLEKHQDLGDNFHDKDIVQTIAYLFDVLGDMGGDDKAFLDWLSQLSKHDRDRAFQWFPELKELWEVTYE